MADDLLYSNHDVSTLITNFHLDVRRLFEEQPTSTLRWIYKQMTFSPVDESQSGIDKKFRALSHAADKILKIMSQDVYVAKQVCSEETLRETIKDKKFSIKIEGQEILLNKLQDFHESMDCLFKKIYPVLEMNPFYKSSSKANKMPKSVQNFLSEELKLLRDEKLKVRKEGKLDSPTHRTERKIAKGNLAIQLGRGIKANKGATGTLIIKDVNGTPLGVHKVSEKDVPLRTRILNIVKSIFGGQLSCLSKAHLAQPRSERAAYLVNEGLGFDVAPSSLEKTIHKKIGVFQVFISKKKETQHESTKIKAFPIDEKIGAETEFMDYPLDKVTKKPKGQNDYMEAADSGQKTLKRVIEQIDSKEKFTENELTLFQKFAIFDYLIGNLDRHEENWFLTVSPNKEITSIRAIDNANAFPKKQPAKKSSAAKNQYKWKSLKLAAQKFTKTTINFVKKNFTPLRIKHVILLIKEMLPANNMDPGFLDAEMEELFLKRATAICHLVTSSHSPKFLADNSTLEDLNKYNLF